MSRWLLALLAFAGTADAACDWKVERKVDPMTDQQACMIVSQQAGIGVRADSNGVGFWTPSAYTREGLTLRIDSNPAIYLGAKERTTYAFGDAARVAVRQILQGTRLRTSYRDYPHSFDGEAEICTLPALIRECGAPMGDILDPRTQGDKVRDATK